MKSTLVLVGKRTSTREAERERELKEVVIGCGTHMEPKVKE